MSSVHDLPRCVAPGERLRITVTGEAGEDGRTVEGTYRGFAGDYLVLEAKRERLEFFDDGSVQTLAVFRPPGGLGDVLGNALGVALGALLAFGPYDDPKGGDRFVVAVGGGALLGGLAGYFVGKRPIPLIAREPGGSSGIEGAVLTGAVSRPELVHTLIGLSQVLQAGDAVRIRQLGGTRTIGRYVGVEAGELLVQVREGFQPRRIPEETIATISRREWHHPSAMKGVLVGGIIGAAIAALAVVDERAHPEDYPDPMDASDVVIGTAVFAGAGAALTRVMGRHDELLMVGIPPGAPSAGRRGIAAGVRASIRF